MRDEVTTYREAVASEVRALMGRRRMTRAQVADALDLSRSYFTRRLLGEHPFNLDEILRLAQVFDVPISALVPEPGSVGRATGVLLKFPGQGLSDPGLGSVRTLDTTESEAA